MNPFKTPGADIFNKDGISPKPSDRVFTKKKPGSFGGGGSGVSKQKAEEEAQRQLEKESEDYFKARDKVKDPPPPERPVVVLSKPRWGEEHGYFNEKVTASVDGQLPTEIAHVTRCDFILYALPAGKRERIEAKSEHLKNGMAIAEFTLFHPSSRDSNGKLLNKCDYIFTAKHRDSKEITSGTLTVRKKKPPRELYEERLKEAVEKLKNVDFGRAEQKYDQDDWFADWERGHSPLDPGGPVVKMDQLSLNAGKNYPDAILKIFENPDKWSFDCFQFYQVCNLYALIDPEDKEKFENQIKSVLAPNDVTEKKTRAIRTFSTQVQIPYESTGVGINKAYFRTAPNGLWTCPPSKDPVKLDIDSLIAQAPMGSRVAWSNISAAPEEGYRVQNAIKMGQNKYWVHGLFTENPRTATREEIEMRHAQYTDPKANAEYVKENIFISDFALISVLGK